jgi:hypothetical protein
MGLAEEAKKMFELSRKAAGEKKVKSWYYKIYKMLSFIFGWSLSGKIVCYIDSVRKK